MSKTALSTFWVLGFSQTGVVHRDLVLDLELKNQAPIWTDGAEAWGNLVLHSIGETVEHMIGVCPTVD